MNLGRRRESHYVPPSPFREDREPEPELEPEPEPERIWRCRVHLRSDNYFELTWYTEEDRGVFVDWLVKADSDTWHQGPTCGFRVADVTGYYLHDYPRHRPE